MIKTILSRAFAVLMKKPVRLWGISLLSVVLGGMISFAFGLLPIVGFCVSLLLDVSMTIIFLRGYRGEEVETAQLFEAFKDGNAKRVLGGMLWMYLWIFLWGLIPVVGFVFAIIRTYEYRLTPYILVMEPEISATDAIKESRKRTMGYKGKMFGADLLVGVIVFVVAFVLGLMCAIPVLGIVAALAILVVIALLPLFIGLVQSAFYEEITNPTIPATPVYSAPRSYTPNYERSDSSAAVPPVAPPASRKFCGNCGTSMNAESAFCPNCGKPC